MKTLPLARILLPLGLTLALAACGSAEEEDVTYETDTEDLSGGELQVADPDAEGVPVDLPQTEMTNVPADQADQEAAPPAPEPAE